ncbi:MAG: GreA/GreB family elongation factor [Patescibacteria group bacterium]
MLHEEQRLEALPSKDERDLLRHIWKAAEVLYGRLQPLPKTITTNRGCTGLVVKLAHQSDEMIEKRGNTEILGLGGPGENDTESKLRIFGINSPIGAALKGKDVGDIVRVFTPDDGHYDVEILSLETLTAFLERLPTSMDGLDAAQLELGFGTSPA